MNGERKKKNVKKIVSLAPTFPHRDHRVSHTSCTYLVWKKRKEITKPRKYPFVLELRCTESL